MDIQKLKQNITEAEQALAKMKEQLEKETKPWVPEVDQQYYYVNNEWEADSNFYRSGMPYQYNQIKNNHNCFKTKEEAQLFAQQIKIKRQLELIAKSLGTPAMADWEQEHELWQRKVYPDRFYLFLDRYGNIGIQRCAYNKLEGITFCLSENFKDEAIKQIGKKKLIAYLKGELYTEKE